MTFLQSPALLICVGGTAPRALDGVASFASWEEFRRSGLEPLAFLFDIGDAEVLDACLRDLRSSLSWACPAFLSQGGLTHPLLDGVATLEQALDAGVRAQAKLVQLGLDRGALDRDERLLLYLYLRESAVLTPVLDRAHEALYRYPLADALGGAAETAGWLPALVRRGLLESGALVDRTRHCPGCGGAHLLFVDVCPQCSSIQIAKSRTLHCFACGNVAPEADFVDEDGIHCPKCHARLRHIGVDYDRPLAQHACGACHNVFIEPRIVARCLSCQALHEPDNLDVREVAELRLTSRGRAALRAGQIHESFAALDVANFVALPYFRHMTDWMMVTARRHHELHASLVLVDFLNAAELIERLGAKKTFLLLDEFATRLREMLRASDVTTRTSEAQLWLLLPFTPAEGVMKKLRDLLAQTQAGDGQPLQARVLAHHVGGQAGSGESARQLMERLAGGADES